MIDTISIPRIATLDPVLRAVVTQGFTELAQKGIIVRAIECLRPYPVQAAYYAQGRQPMDVVNGLRKIAGLPLFTDANQNVKNTNSQPGLSYHQYGLAFDFCLVLNGGKQVSFNQKLDYNHDNFPDWMQVVNWFTAKGWVWGAAWSDFDHLEYHRGHNIVQLKQLHDAGKLDEHGYLKQAE